ncbi:MAG: hypothetical protein FWF73_04345 [Spirochaetes bacterium]|nr:hypothetical protein [Spirochaetota bacterium]
MNNNLVNTGLMSYVIKNVFYSIYNKNFTFLILFILTLSFSACSKGKSPSGDGGDKPGENIATTVTKIDNNTSEENEEYDNDFMSCIAYGNGLFVAGVSDGKIAYSSDGVTWKKVKSTSFGKGSIYRITYGNGRFVAFGNNIIGKDKNKEGYSRDGITWKDYP